MKPTERFEALQDLIDRFSSVFSVLSRENQKEANKLLTTLEDMARETQSLSHEDLDWFIGNLDTTFRQYLAQLDETRTHADVEKETEVMKPSQPLVISQIGDYRLLQKIGQGGFGTVYLAHHDRHGKVAVKVINESYFHPIAWPHIEKRFMREVNAMKGLTHPHIVKALDFFTEPQPVLVMEYVDGQTLRQMMTSSSCYTDKNIRQIIRQLSEAISFVHQNKHIHRDIKPENILIDKANRLKLCDFGIVVRSSETMQRFSATQPEHPTRAGTEDYAAPEQLSGAMQDATVDIHALATITCELIFGTRSKKKEDLTQPKIFVQNLNTLQSVLFNARHDRPSRRHQTAEFFFKELATACWGDTYSPAPAVEAPQTARARAGHQIHTLTYLVLAILAAMTVLLMSVSWGLMNAHALNLILDIFLKPTP